MFCQRFLTKTFKNEITAAKIFYMAPKNKKNQGRPQNAGASSLGDEEESNESGAVFTNKKGQLCLSIRGKPGANQTQITDVQTDSVGVRISAPPVDGEANKELIKYMSKLLGLSKSDVALDKGSRSRHKVLVLTNCKLSPEDITDLFWKEID